MPSPPVLTTDELHAALERLPDWRAGDGELASTFGCPSAAAALALIAAIGEAAEELNHHPDVDWRYNKVLVRTSTHEVDGQVTQRDVVLAERISAAALAHGASAG